MSLLARARGTQMQNRDELRCCELAKDASSRKPGQLQLGGAFLVLLAAILLLSACGKKEAPPVAGPPQVDVVQVIQQDVPVFQEWVAQINGPVNAEITPKVQGYLLKQHYQNGYFVKAGQLLFEIDPRPFQAALDGARADLAAMEANLARTDADVARDTPLAAQNAIPQKQLDNDLASQAAFRARVLANKAAVKNAELNLEWTKIHSPITGIAGVSSSQIGDLVGPSSKMVTVSQVDPIWTYFNISEPVFLHIAPKIAQVLRGTGSMKNAPFPPVVFIQADGLSYPKKGKIVYVNRQVGTQTGTIQVAAEFPNPEAVLRPGGFGRVRIQTGMLKDALLVPQAAVIEVQSEYQLIVLKPDSKATFRPVKVGERVGTNWIISEGLKPGERVVVQGIQKIQTSLAQAPQMAKEGVPVAPNPYVPASTGARSN